MNWNTMNDRFAERAGARSCSQSLLDLLIPTRGLASLCLRVGRDDAYSSSGKGSGLVVVYGLQPPGAPVWTGLSAFPDCGPKTLRE